MKKANTPPSNVSAENNRLYFGDNLNILREHIRDESVDLIYLDPPFNSHANYNVLFKSPKGAESLAQIEAFEDTWHWNEQAEREFTELVHQSNTDVSEMIQALRRFLGENDMMAYLTMMANRLLELHRVLKPTGSLYLHCDPTASHYLKVVLDGVFGKGNFRNEITWKRQSAHSDAKKKFANVSDIIFFYVKSEAAAFTPLYIEHDPEYIRNFYRHDDGDGRGLYRLSDMASPNPRPNMMYEWLGYGFPAKGWRYEKATMQKLHDEGRIYYPVQTDGQADTTKRLALKRYLNEQEGSIVTNVWTDINALSAAAAESLGYPTQKPVALLERIIQASSNAGDVVLDPFCGCGTAVHAAQKLGRSWIGIDITHLAISLIEKRLHDAFPQIDFAVEGTPKDFEGARDLALRDKYQFQWWACSLVNAQPFQGKKKGADGGIDGLIYFKDDSKLPKKIIVSVKGGENVSRTMVADLKNAVEREKAQLGLFVTLTPPTAPMKTEASAAGFYDSPHHGSFPKIQILTVAGLLLGTERARYPDMSYGVQTFKPAKVEEKTRDQTDLF
jgi:DNA modification methylase